MQERFEVNRRNKVDVHVVTTPFSSSNGGVDSNVFCSWMEKPLCSLDGVPLGVGDRDYIQTKDVVVLSGTVRLPFADRIPPYTTWIFLDRHLLTSLFHSFTFVSIDVESVVLSIAIFF